MVEQKISVPKYWRRIPQYYRLEASKCVDCGRVYYPPRTMCRCGSRRLVKINLPTTGKLIHFTILHQVGVDYEKVKPIVIGLVDLGETKILSQLTDCLDYSKLSSGIEVELVLRKVKVDNYYGIIIYGYKFRPVRIEWC